MELEFLGTVAGMPVRDRNVTSICLRLLQERGSVWLFDCGEGTQHQILRSTIKLSKLEKIFITHLHGDHIYGLPGILTSRAYSGGNSPLTIYGPKGIRDYVTSVLLISQAHLGYDLHIEEIPESLNEGIVFEDDQFLIETAKLEHRIDSYGYSITEKDQPGPLLIEKLQKAGIPPGPLFSQIKKGIDITLENGEKLIASQYVGPKLRGRKVVIMGDTRICNTSPQIAMDADVLVHESTFTEDLCDLAYKYFHTTALQAAKLARDSNVDQLILTHISSRYQDEGLDRLLQEAKSVHENTHIAHDFWIFPIKRNHE
ncbi:ribonuclease Z [Chengkuizengella axinellae]|uniref:Ribonuclease Z n=1 Tax=Chengkuizengella axinellae TaxID=3064388 RepID=A0ABT9IZ15_9BACL|nr:ribonuclease Z [Chengkuizengella sp. 2205SS18-9]MDP5274035.1 ribonuclease Z [Chengkuizengella sp. 2205SS18-9]